MNKQIQTKSMLVTSVTNKYSTYMILIQCKHHRVLASTVLLTAL